MRFIDFKQIIRDSIWAAGEAENLVKQHDNMFLEAMSELQNGVEYERHLNVDVIPFRSTWYKGGLTVIRNGVPGRVTSVYTIGNCQWTDPVWYHQADPMEPQKWAHNLEVFSKGKENASWPKLPLGFRAADCSTDRIGRHNNAGIDIQAAPRIAGDGETVTPPTPDQVFDAEASNLAGNANRRWPRARRGIWSWSDRDIHIAPWIQSNEEVIIEWMGIKNNWADADLVSEEIDVAKFVMLYVQFAHERNHGDLKMAVEVLKPLAADCLADIIHERKTRLRRTHTENMELRDRFAHELRESGQCWDGDDIALPTSPAPTLAQARRGIGSPQGVVAGQRGDIYIDDTSGAFYWNSNGQIDGWKP